MDKQGGRRLGKQGQAISYDFIVGLSIALLMLAYYISLWGTFANRYSASFTREGGDSELLAAADALVNSPGYPDNWTLSPSSVSLIGLAATPGRLAPEKVGALALVPYGTARKALGLGRDFYIRVEGASGERYAELGVPSNSSTASSEITRLAMMNGSMVNVRVQVYGG